MYVCKHDAELLVPDHSRIFLPASRQLSTGCWRNIAAAKQACHQMGVLVYRSCRSNIAVAWKDRGATPWSVTKMAPEVTTSPEGVRESRAVPHEVGCQVVKGGHHARPGASQSTASQAS